MSGAAYDDSGSTATGQSAPASVQRRQLLALCLHYWEAVYAYMCRHCASPEAAQALTAAFFRDLHARVANDAMDFSDGRFRRVLLGELRRFLAEADAGAASRPTQSGPAAGQAE